MLATGAGRPERGDPGDVRAPLARSEAVGPVVRGRQVHRGRRAHPGVQGAERHGDLPGAMATGHDGFGERVTIES
jgi:hypothetical protein